MKKRTLLVICLAALCLGAAPAMADLFGFSYSNPRTTFDGASLFTAQDAATTTGDVYRNIAPAGTASFDSGSWGTGSEDFLIQMTLSSITGSTADGSGTFTLTDVEGDTISGNLAGQWVLFVGSPIFSGSLSNVTYTSVVDNTFDGHSGSGASMIFSAPQPWNGTLVEITTRGTWFQSGSYDAQGGSIDATVVPVPGAVLLGMLGLSVAGIRLRKSA